MSTAHTADGVAPVDGGVGVGAPTGTEVADIDLAFTDEAIVHPQQAEATTPVHAGAVPTSAAAVPPLAAPILAAPTHAAPTPVEATSVSPVVPAPNTVRTPPPTATDAALARLRRTVSPACHITEPRNGDDGNVVVHVIE
jgi:hypothetical protein